MTEDERELMAMRRTRERLAHPPFRPVGDWRVSRAAMVAAYDRAIARAERNYDLIVLGRCPHGVDLDREFCPQGCRV